MARELRIDLGTLKPPQRRADGTMLVEGALTRSGVFLYRDAKGNERREYRPPDEVFHADAMSSFELVPVTNDHPAEGVTAENARQLARGAVGKLRRDGNHVVAPIAVWDAETIADVEAGKRELSCGYTAEVLDQPGVSPDGERYDAIQRSIRGNHLAIVEVARAGREACIRMDAAVMVAEASREFRADGGTMKVRIDGVEYDVSEQVAQAFAKKDAAHGEALKAEKARADEAESQAQSQKGRADGLEKELEKERKARADAEAALPAQVQARVELISRAAPILGEDLSKKTEREIKVAVVKKVDGDDIAAEQHDSYVNGRFDSAMKRADAAGASRDAARRAVMPVVTQDETDRDFDEDAASRRMRERTDAKWQKAPSGSEEK